MFKKHNVLLGMLISMMIALSGGGIYFGLKGISGFEIPRTVEVERVTETIRLECETGICLQVEDVYVFIYVNEDPCEDILMDFKFPLDKEEKYTFTLKECSGSIASILTAQYVGIIKKGKGVVRVQFKDCGGRKKGDELITQPKYQEKVIDCFLNKKKELEDFFAKDTQ